MRVDCASKDLTRYVKRSAQFYSEYILQARGYGSSEQSQLDTAKEEEEETSEQVPLTLRMLKSQ